MVIKNFDCGRERFAVSSFLARIQVSGDELIELISGNE